MGCHRGVGHHHLRYEPVEAQGPLTTEIGGPVQVAGQLGRVDRRPPESRSKGIHASPHRDELPRPDPTGELPVNGRLVLA